MQGVQIFPDNYETNVFFWPWHKSFLRTNSHCDVRLNGPQARNGQCPLISTSSWFPDSPEILSVKPLLSRAFCMLCYLTYIPHRGGTPHFHLFLKTGTKQVMVLLRYICHLLIIILFGWFWFASCVRKLEVTLYEFWESHWQNWRGDGKPWICSQWSEV